MIVRTLYVTVRTVRLKGGGSKVWRPVSGSLAKCGVSEEESRVLALQA